MSPHQDPEVQAQTRIDELSAVFAPRSIAIVGASDTATKIGGIPVDFQQRFGYAGSIYPVNPRAGLIQGLQAYPSISAIGAPVDLAIFAIPESLVPFALADAIKAGVRGVVLFTSGYAEVSEAGAQAQARLAATARAAGIRLIGPNCLGFMNIRRHVYATFSPAPNVGRVRAGNIGIVSQSGAFGAYAYSLARERDIGISHWVTTGNEADIDFADCVEWLAHDPDTQVIMGYMEGCRDGFKLRRALAAARAAKKPVVIVKVGRTAIGAQAAASHTAALAGNDAVYDAVFREYGVHRAIDVAEFFGVAASASIAASLPRERSIGLFTLSGGVGVLMADAAGDARLEVRPMPQHAQDQIRDWVPFAGPVNPVDITGQVTNDLTLIERTARLMLEQGNYASWIGFLAAAGASDKLWPVIESLVTNLRRDYPDKLLAICTLLAAPRRSVLEGMGCLVYSDPSEAVRSIAALATFAERFADAGAAVTATSAVPLLLPPGTQSEPQALATLAAAGISTADHQLAQSATEAVAVAARYDAPVVLKVVSRDITHKSDIGGVALGLRGDEAVRTAYERMRVSVRQHAPSASVDGVLVAPMVSGGVECILGAHYDPVFGPIVMFGLGGVFVELLGDVALHSAPVDDRQAMEMIRSIKGFALLSGARGREAVDLETLAANLAALSRLAFDAGDSLQSIDINPFIALPRERGGGCAVDAVIVGRTQEGAEAVNTALHIAEPNATATATANATGVRDPRFALGQSVGLAAFVWGYPLVETVRTCRLQTVSSANDPVSWRAAIDRLHHVQNASTASDRDVVTPANDLLYTTAWIHLADGPRLLQVPSREKHRDRYFVLALYDAWTNNFENPGLRLSPAQGETVALVGPGFPKDHDLPPGVRVVRSLTELVWMIARVVVGEGEDVPLARLLQADIGLECAPGTDMQRLPLAVQHWAGAAQDSMAALRERPDDAAAIAADFFTNLCHSLADSAVPREDTGLAAWFARAGLVPGLAFDWARLDAPLRAGLQQGLVDAAASIETGSRSRVARPWAAHFELGRYGCNYMTRALTAYKGLGALASDEAVYAMGDFDADRKPLCGDSRYLLRFEPGDLPPVDAFWSVTLYDADRFLYSNALSRYAIGDRTQGLRRDPDGGLTLLVSHAPPSGETSNWLPAPAGSFYLVMRMYCPRADARSWRIPPLRPIAG